MIKKILFAVTVLIFPVILSGQDIMKMPWKNVATKMQGEWYATKEAHNVAENVLRYQMTSGGWPKNIAFQKGVNEEELKKLKETGIGSTFDNGATLTEMQFMVNMYSHTGDGRYRESFLKAFRYIIDAQYPNGGWPQFYPARPSRSVSYSNHITYNDNAMVNIMNMLKDIYSGDASLKAMKLDDSIRSQARESFSSGLGCILKTQIIFNGKPTVWCAQHDEVTFKPAKARAYELPSFSGSESVGLALLLMSVDNPSDSIIAAVKGAVEWFKENKIENMALERFTDENGKKEVKVVESPGAPPMWARFYDLETVKPFFCDRDGIKKSSLSEIGKERRNGYSWYTTSPQKVINTYNKWIKKL